MRFKFLTSILALWTKVLVVEFHRGGLCEKSPDAPDYIKVPDGYKRNPPLIKAEPV